MTPYLLLLAFVTSTSYLGRRYGDHAVRRLSLLLTGSVLVLFAGLRDSQVGTDTRTYVDYFFASEDFGLVLERQDFGYYFLSWAARQISDSYSILLIMVALIVVPCYLATITRIVRRYETAVYLFVALSVYTFFFNGARQGIAAAICFLALSFLLERRLLPYIILIALAATFHRTAVVALPLYWIASPRVRWQRLAILVGATVLAVAFLELFVAFASDLLSDRYAHYAEAGEGGGEVWVAYLVGQGALLYFFNWRKPDADDRYSRLLNIYLAGLVPALASTISSVDPSGLLRLHMYFSSVAILLWPMAFRQFRTPTLRIVLAACVATVTLIFFVLTTSTFSDLIPYRLSVGILL